MKSRKIPGAAVALEPRRRPVTGTTPTAEETVVVATFFESPPAGPLVIPADTPACAT